MDKKIFGFVFIAFISSASILFLYFYSLENAKNYWNVDDGKGNIYAPIEYIANNIEKFEGKEWYASGYVALSKYRVFIPYNTIYPTKEKIKIEISNGKDFLLEDEKYYVFKSKIIGGRIEGDTKVIEIYATEKFQPLIDWPFGIYEILSNVPAVLIMLYLLLKLKIDFKRFLISSKS